MAIQNLTGTDTVSNLVSKFNENFEEVYLKSGPELTLSNNKINLGINGFTLSNNLEWELAGSSINIKNGGLYLQETDFHTIGYTTFDIVGATVNFTGSTINFEGATIQNFPSDTLPYIPTAGGEFSGKIYPSTTNTISIGDTNHRLTGIYANNLYMSSPGGSIMHSGSITLYPGGMTSNGISIVADQTNKEFSYIIPSSEGVHGYVGTTNYYFSSMHSDTYAFNSGIYLRYNDNNSQIAVIEPGLYTAGAGVNVRFGANQATMITAGEGCLGVVDDTTYNGGENVILAADSAVEFIVGANTYANHKAVFISAQSLSPWVTNTMTLGTSARRWTNVYGTTINTDKIEFNNDDNITYNDNNNTFLFMSDGRLDNSFLQCGQLSVKPRNASCGMGVWYVSDTSDVCVVPLRDVMHQVNGKGNIGTGSYKWDYVQANHVTGTSDIEIKENMTQFDESYAYESIRNIPIYNYQMVDRENTYYVGTTTQEMPVEMVHLFDGGKGSEYLPNSSIWFLYGAFKEAQRKIDALEQEINELRGN